MNEETLMQTTTYNKKLAQTIRQQGIINEQMLSSFLNKCNQTGINLGQALVQQKVISAHNLVEVIRAMNTNAAVSNKQQVITTKKFGKYNIIKELGRGGMGVVYLVEQPDIKRTLVLKTLLPTVGSDIVQVKRFYKEAETVSTLHHPNIIPIYEFGQENNMPYFTMQFIDGTDFQHFIDQENFDMNVCLQIIEKISRALHYAHEKGVVHRDIKPANIMLDKNFEPYLADFGLAKHQNKKSSLTQTGAVIGTPFYLSPEQVKGSRRAIDHRTDIYSMGIILYKVLSGEFPFTAGELPSLYRKILRDLPTPPKKLNPSISSNLNYICLKAIAKNSDERYQTAHAFAEALKNFRAKKAMKNEERLKISWRYWWAQYNKLISRIAVVSISVIIALSIWAYSSHSYHSLLQKHQQVYYDVLDFIQQNQYQKAIARVQPLSSEKSAFVLAAKAHIQYEWFNNKTTAQKFFEQALQLSENNTEILYAYSRFLFTTKKYLAVLPHLNKAIDLNKQNSEYYRLRAKVYQKLRKDAFFARDIALATKIENANIKQGLQKLRQHKQQQNWTGALVVLNGIISRYPHCETAYRERAQIYQIREQMTSAVNDITHAISLNPSLENYALQAQWLFDLGQKEDALRSYKYLLEKKQQADIYQKVLQLQVETAKFQQAISLYKSMPQDYKNNETKQSVAQAYFYKKDYAAALQALPSESSPHINYYRGISLFHLKKYRQATAILKQLLKSAQKNLTLDQQVDIFYFSAKILYNRKKFTAARNYLLKAIKVKPTDPNIHFLLAEVYQKLKNYEQALKYYSVCIDLQPWKIEFYMKRGLVYRALQKWSRANYDFLKCIELKSTNIDLISHIYECAYTEKDPFKKFTMQNTLKGKLLNIYNRINLNLFEQEKNQLATDFLNATLPAQQKFDDAKLKLAESFVQTITKNASSDVMQIASNGLQGLYGLVEVQQLVLRYAQNERFGKKTRLYLQQIYEKLRERYFADKEVEIKQKIVRYFIAQDSAALLELYKSRDYAIDVLKYLLHNEDKNILVRFYAAETLVSLKLREAVRILQEGVNSSTMSAALICKVILAKSELAASPNISYQDLKNMPSFLVIKCIEHTPLSESTLDKLLKNSDVKISLHAAQKLWNSGNQTPLPILKEYIQSPQKKVQRFALDVFWNLKNHSTKWQREIVKKYLPQLFAFSDHKDPVLRKLAVAKMADISSDQIVDKVRTKLRDKNKDVRAQAISTLAKRGDIMTILQITENPDEEIAMRLAPFSYFETAQNATKVPIFKVLSFATKMLKDPDPRIRFIIITYLMRANDGKSAPYTISQVNLKNDDDRLAAAFGMAQSGMRMMPYLQKYIKEDSREDIRVVAAASAINVFLLDKKPQLKKLQELHQQIKTYNTRIQEGAAFGYSYRLYQDYYHTSELKSSIFHEVNNEFYDTYLHNLETQISTAKASTRDIFLLCVRKATELSSSNRCLLERAVVEYICKRFAESRRTLLSIKGMDDNPSYLYWKAKIHLHGGELKEAKQAVAQAQENRPWTKRYLILHARIEKALGNQKACDELMDRATLLR
ncbi:protein kinase domain-containing protein [Candidatus Uabimicrobium amorphum]|uniref:non-specific serine/threonine protein kinase n=1 Tax=Uabimicrobium amorphum TaxID=2596890 RepID=A0A5S9F3J7_UABAM|nr:protein kinase [Candidatus Uabimicrobium amorphum]BBM84331.1 protein kinase [Candidatus Uabimicrobium amorphum]